MNPLWLGAFALTGECHAFSEDERVSNQNCVVLRHEIRAYIEKRIKGEVKSSLMENSDIVSLML